MYEPIKNILEAIFVEHQQGWNAYLLQNWPTIVGTLAQRMRLEKIVGDMLVIGVYDAHWMHELHMLSSTIMRTINAKLGDEKIKKLRFNLVERRTFKKKYPAPLLHEQPQKPVMFSKRETQALAHIKNKDLHEALKKYFERCMQR